jgi:DNA-binding HxlR family transcriptional regulator
VGGKWKTPILWSLYKAQRPLRFVELKRSLPRISQRMLSRQLRELEVQGILSRNIRQVKPPRVEYAMTEHGRTLHAVLIALCRWGKANGRSE